MSANELENSPLMNPNDDNVVQFPGRRERQRAEEMVQLDPEGVAQLMRHEAWTPMIARLLKGQKQKPSGLTSLDVVRLNKVMALIWDITGFSIIDDFFSKGEVKVFSQNVAAFVDDLRGKFPSFLSDPIAGDKGQSLVELGDMSDADIVQLGLRFGKYLKDARIPLGLSPQRAQVMMRRYKEAPVKFVVDADGFAYCKLKTGMDVLEPGTVAVTGMLDPEDMEGTLSTHGLIDVEEIGDKAKGVRVGSGFATLLGENEVRDLADTDFSRITDKEIVLSDPLEGVDDVDLAHTASLIGFPYNVVYQEVEVSKGMMEGVMSGNDTILGRSVAIIGYPEGSVVEEHGPFLAEMRRFAKEQGFNNFKMPKVDQQEMIFITFDFDLTKAHKDFELLYAHMQRWSERELKGTFAYSSGMMPVRPAGWLSAAVDMYGAAAKNAALMYKKYAVPSEIKMYGFTASAAGSSAEWEQGLTNKGVTVPMVSIRPDAQGKYSLDNAANRTLRSNANALIGGITSKVLSGQAPQLLSVEAQLTEMDGRDVSELVNAGEGLGKSAVGRQVVERLKQVGFAAENLMQFTDKVAPVSMALMQALSAHCPYEIKPGMTAEDVLSTVKSFDPDREVFLHLDEMPKSREDKMVFGAILSRLGDKVRIMGADVRSFVSGDLAGEVFMLEEFSQDDFVESVMDVFPQFRSVRSVLKRMLTTYMIQHGDEMRQRYMLSPRLALHFAKNVHLVKGEESVPLFSLAELPSESGWTAQCEPDFYGQIEGQYVRQLVDKIGRVEGFREVFSLLAHFNGMLTQEQITRIIVAVSPASNVAEDLFERSVEQGLLRTVEYGKENYYELALVGARASFAEDLYPWSPAQTGAMLAEAGQLAFEAADLPEVVRNTALDHYLSMYILSDDALLALDEKGGMDAYAMLGERLNERIEALIDGGSALDLYFFAEKLAGFFGRTLANSRLIRLLNGRSRYELARSILLYASSENKNLNRIAALVLANVTGEYESKARLLLKAESKVLMSDSGGQRRAAEKDVVEKSLTSLIGLAPERESAVDGNSDWKNMRALWAKIQRLQSLYVSTEQVDVCRKGLDGIVFYPGFDGEMKVNEYKEAYEDKKPKLSEPDTEEQRAISFMMTYQYARFIYFAQKFLTNEGLDLDQTEGSRLERTVEEMTGFIDQMEAFLPATVGDKVSNVDDAESYRRYGLALMELGRVGDLAKVRRAFEISKDYHVRFDSLSTHEGLLSLLAGAQAPYKPFRVSMIQQGLRSSVGPAVRAVAGGTPGEVGSALRDMVEAFGERIDRDALPKPGYLRSALNSIENEYLPTALGMIRPSNQITAYVAKFDLILMASICSMIPGFEYGSEYAGIVDEFSGDLESDIECLKRAGFNYPADQLMLRCVQGYVQEGATEHVATVDLLGQEPRTDEFTRQEIDGEQNASK